VLRVAFSETQFPASLYIPFIKNSAWEKGILRRIPYTESLLERALQNGITGSNLLEKQFQVSAFFRKFGKVEYLFMATVKDNKTKSTRNKPDG
jgi:hypothetical protein